MPLRVPRAARRADGRSSKQLGGRWNISLFHYRNHGADFGRVLAGFEVPPGEMEGFERFLQALGYEHKREDSNHAYRMFLT